MAKFWLHRPLRIHPSFDSSAPEDGSLKVDGVLQPYILNGYAPRWHLEKVQLIVDSCDCTTNKSMAWYNWLNHFESDSQAKWIQIDAKLISLVPAWPQQNNQTIKPNGWTGTQPDFWVHKLCSYIFMVHNCVWIILLALTLVQYVCNIRHVHHWGHLLPTLQLLRPIRAREPRDGERFVGCFFPDVWLTFVEVLDDLLLSFLSCCGFWLILAMQRFWILSEARFKATRCSPCSAWFAICCEGLRLAGRVKGWYLSIAYRSFLFEPLQGPSKVSI